jgi:hypothetical protein
MELVLNKMKTINKILGTVTLALSLAGCCKECNINGRKVVNRIDTPCWECKDDMVKRDGKFYLYHMPISVYGTNENGKFEEYNIDNNTHKDSVAINEANKTANYFIHQMYLQEKEKEKEAMEIKQRKDLVDLPQDCSIK